MSELASWSTSTLSPSERKQFERLADSDVPCSDLAAAYLEVYDEYEK